MSARFDSYEVRPVAGARGFTWHVYGLRFPSSKSGHAGEVFFLGTPKRTRVMGPFPTRSDAQAAMRGAL